MSGDISPPLSKRQRLDLTEEASSSTSSSDLTIYAWNINGIQPFIQRPITSFFKHTETSSTSSRIKTQAEAPPTASLRAFLRRHQWPTLLCLQEVKINPDDQATQRTVCHAVRASHDSGEPDYAAHFCLPSDAYNARGFGRKVYGVCTIVRQDLLNASVRTVDWDVEGRMLVVETPATTLRPPLSIFNIYAVNGTDNPYKDPKTGAVAGTRHDRKLAVHALLLEECKRLEREGRAVILAGDMNIARGVLDGHPNLRTVPARHVRNRADFNDKFFDDPRGLRAIDTFRHLHGEEKRYTYHPRGGEFGHSCDRIDLILCSRSLEGALKTAGILDTPAERGTSDHCPLFASFAWREAVGG